MGHVEHFSGLGTRCEMGKKVLERGAGWNRAVSDPIEECALPWKSDLAMIFFFAKFRLYLSLSPDFLCLCSLLGG